MEENIEDKFKVRYDEQQERLEPTTLDIVEKASIDILELDFLDIFLMRKNK